MSIIPISYEQFITSNQALVSSGGPWNVQSDQAQCLSSTDVGCDGYCLQCQVFPPDSLSAYHPTFNANISVNLANYGNSTNLDFTWTYWPLYCGSNITAGSAIPINSQIGNTEFNDVFPAVDYVNFFQGGHQWDNASKISHSASTAVTRSSDPTRGYIPLKINFTMSPLTNSHEEYLNYYIKDIEFKITTPLQSTTSTSSDPSSSTFTLGVGGQDPPRSSTTTPVGVIAGATVGTVVFIALLLLAFLLFHRRRAREKRRILDDDPLPHEGEGPIPIPWVAPPDSDSARPPPSRGVHSNGRPTTSRFQGNTSGKRARAFRNRPGPAAAAVLPTGPSSGSGNQNRNHRHGRRSSDPNSLPMSTLPPTGTGRSTSFHSTSFFSGTTSDPPPTYGRDDSVIQETRTPPPPPMSPSFSPELARFASAHRDVINENLEARLQAAGYLPTDDPSRLTAEEWKNEYRITKLELRRLQDLYSQNRQIKS